MSQFRVHCYEHRDVRWIELDGSVCATAPARIREEVATAFEAPSACRFVLDLSQVPEVGSPTLEAILGAIPRGHAVGLIPPPVPGWADRVEGRVEVSATIFADAAHAMSVLGMRSRGEPAPSARPPERRRAPRVGTQIRARIWFDHPHGGRLGRAVVSNVSKSGAYLTNIDCQLTAEEFRYFTAGIAPIQLYIPVADAQRHDVRSRIVRVETDRVGPHLAVRFECADPDFGAALDRFLVAAASGRVERTPSGRYQKFYS